MRKPSRKTIKFFSSVFERGRREEVIKYFAICHWHYTRIPLWKKQKPIISWKIMMGKSKLPKSVACFNILYVPIVHSDQISFNKYFNQGLKHLVLVGHSHISIFFVLLEGTFI